MKKLKPLSLFKILFLTLINLFFNNTILFVVSLIYLLLVDRKATIVYIIVIVIIFLNNYRINDPLKIGYVEKINTKYVTVDKILYKTIIYNVEDLEVGDLVKTKGKVQRIKDEISLRNNIRFSSTDVKKIGSNPFLKASINKLNKFDDNKKNLFKKIIFNDYVSNNDLDYFFGYGFCLYYFFLIIQKKNKHLCILLVLLYVIFFGFEIKFLLLIINYILSFFRLNRLEKMSIKYLIICFINNQLIYNYSFLISLIFNFLDLLSINNYFIISLIQSLLFGKIQLLSSFIYKYIIGIRIIMSILVILSFIFEFTISFNFLIVEIFSKLLKILSFSIKGKINIVLFIVILITYQFNFKYKNLIFYFLLIVLLITPLNNPFNHVSFIDVGQGDSILLRGTFNSYNVLIDTGSSYNYNKLSTFLDNEGIYSLDYIIITHNDLDHNGNLENLLKDYKVKNVVVDNIDVCVKDLFLKNLYVDNFDNDNDNSLIYHTKIKNLSFLFTGDISNNVERLLINKYHDLDVDVLKVSHHGSSSATSSYFLGKILPYYGVISTNGMYNHPSKEVIDNLNAFIVKTLITKELGSISFYLFNNFTVVTTQSGQIDIIK